MKPNFWFVQVELSAKPLRHASYAVAAFTERSARVQTRKRIGKGPKIIRVNPVDYAHAWRIDFED
jgi:hypothetical protein